MLSALELGLFERSDVPEPLTDLLMLSLTLAAADPYIVVPPRLQGVKPLPIIGVEKTVAALIKLVAGSRDEIVRRRSASILAGATNSWPTMNPSQLMQHQYGTGLIGTDQPRRWLLNLLKQSRSRPLEATALAILTKLRSADFRDLHPMILRQLTSMTSTGMGTRVQEVFEAVAEFYPTHSYHANEQCELLVYEQYVNRKTGAGKMMERLYGPLLRYSQPLRPLLKKGAWLSNPRRYEEWYPGEEEPR